jgi:hypothetical protein
MHEIVPCDALMLDRQIVRGMNDSGREQKRPRANPDAQPHR